MSRRERLKLNVWLLYVIKASKWFMLFMPVIIPFYHFNGLSAHDVLLLKAIYSVAILVFEIPSGYFGDVIGRRTSIITGSFLGLAGFIIYSLSGGFYEFLAGEILLGLGASFISGSDSALLFDTLKDLKKEDQYLKFEGRTVAVGNFSEGLAGIAGGLIAAYISLRAPYFAQIGVELVALPAAILLLEPKVFTRTKKAGFGEISSIVAFALFRNAKLRGYILFSSVIGVATLTLAWFVQYYFIEVGLDVQENGIVWALLWATLQFSVSVFSWFAHSIERNLGQKFTMSSILVVISLGFVLLGLFEYLWGIVFIYLFYFMRGIATPTLRDYINRITPSESRATILSVRSLIIRSGFVFIGPFTGWLKDSFSLSYALMITGGIVLITGGINLIFLLKSIIRSQAYNQNRGYS